MTDYEEKYNRMKIRLETLKAELEEMTTVAHAKDYAPGVAWYAFTGIDDILKDRAWDHDRPIGDEE